MQRITFDFESRSACDIQKAGAWAYAQHPTTDVICLWFADRNGETRAWYSRLYNRIVNGFDQDDPIPPWFIDMVEAGVIFEAHGTMFERAIYKHHMEPRGWPVIPEEQWFDTMAACAFHGLPLDLDTVSNMLKLKTVKNREGSAALQKIMKPVTIKRGKPKAFDTNPEYYRIVGGPYGRDDVLSQMYLGKRLGPLSDTEQQTWLLNQRMNLRGIKLDLDFAADCQAVIDKARVPLLKAFQEIVDLKPKSPYLRHWINEQMGHERDPDNLKVVIETAEAPFFENLQKETVEEALNDWELTDKVREVLDMKAALTSASVDKIKSMFACCGEDGRARGLIQYGGAVSTLRDAGRLLQPQNFPRGTIKLPEGVDMQEFLISMIRTRDVEAIGAALAHQEKHISEEYRHLVAPVSAVASSLRHAIVADKGKLLCCGDFSTIEVRVLLAIGGQHDKIELLAGGHDPYCDLASKIYLQEVTKADVEMRQTGKNAVLGLGFQMGAEKFLAKYGNGQDIEFCKKVLEIYREDWAPKVPKLWYGLQEASTKAVWDRTPQEFNGIVYQIEDEWLTCRLPSGRKLWYFAPKAVNREMPWSTEERPDIRPGWTYRAKKYGAVREIAAYGGLLTENVVQATARDILYTRAPVLEEYNMPLILTVHDEAVTEPDEDKADPDLMQQIMEERVDWVKALGVPVAAECWTGERYRK